jgi:hypothetical protein
LAVLQLFESVQVRLCVELEQVLQALHCQFGLQVGAGAGFGVGVGAGAETGFETGAASEFFDGKVFVAVVFWVIAGA